LAEIKQQLEEEQAAADATKKRMAAEQAQWRRDNDERILAKHAARAEQNAEDARLVDATMKALEKKEKDRQQALKDFQVLSSLAGRASICRLHHPNPATLVH
jgi:Na+-translocating ferredoxin:NAD+ oxidoreductase RnfC subunit